MARLGTQEKLAILADAAKYDASCASSGSSKRDSKGGKGLGSTEGMGICHAYAPDGRCISLLKILLTNAYIFDCAYCINRKRLRGGGGRRRNRCFWDVAARHRPQARLGLEVPRPFPGRRQPRAPGSPAPGPRPRRESRR